MSKPSAVRPAWTMASLILALCLLLSLAACRSTDSAVYQESAPASPAAESRAKMAGQSMAMDNVASVPQEMKAEGGSIVGGAQHPTELLKPQIIKTAALNMTVKDMVASIKAMHGLTTRFGGLVTNQSMSVVEAEGGYRQGSLEVRIPQSKLEGFLEALSKQGEITYQQISGRDVGAEMVDLESRLRNKRAEEAALQGIMQRAGKIPEVLQVANELARVRGEIEQAQGQLNYLKQQVAYSTVTINFSEQAVASPTQGKPGFLTTLENAVKQALGALYDLILWIAGFLVWLVIYLIPLGLVVFGLFRLLGWLLRKVWKLKLPNPFRKKPPVDPS